MRIGVIADTHLSGGNNSLPQKIIEDFKGVDMVIHAGDLGSLDVLDQLKSLCADVRAVWGNMDPDEVRNALAEKEVIQAGRYKIGLTHGRGSPNGLIEMVTEVFKTEKVDLIIFGHSHSAVNTKEGGIIYFNPGSPTDKMFATYNSYGLIEINDGINAKIVKL